MKLFDHRVRNAALAEVRQTYVAAVGRSGQCLFEMIQREVVDSIHRLTLCFGLAFGGGHLLLLDLDIVLFGEPAYGFDIRHSLEVHQKADSRAGLTAAEAFEYAFCGVDGERRRTVVMERAEPPVVGTALFKRHEVADDVDDVCRVHYLVNRYTVNSRHCGTKVLHFSLRKNRAARFF